MKDYIQELFEEDLDNENIFYTVTESAIDKETEESFEELEDKEKDAFMVGSYIMEVGNGGFDHYFTGGGSLYAKGALEALDLISEKRFSKLLEEAISVYKAVIPDDVKMQELSSLDDQFSEISQADYRELYDRFTEYIRDND